MTMPRPRSLGRCLRKSAAILLAVGLVVTSRASAARVQTIPFFEDTFASGGQTFTYRMVGTNPKRSRRTTRIGTVIVPLRFVFPDGPTFDPGGHGVAASRLAPLRAHALRERRHAVWRRHPARRVLDVHRRARTTTRCCSAAPR